MRNDKEVVIQVATEWWRIFRNQRLTVKQVILTAIEGEDTTKNLREMLAVVAPSPYPGSYSGHKLGHWLSRCSGLNITIGPETYIFVDHGPQNGFRTWQLRLESYSEELAKAEAELPDGFLDAVA